MAVCTPLTVGRGVTRSGRKGTLAQTAAFRQAEAELGRTGDLFGYFNVGELRAALLRETAREVEQEVTDKIEEKLAAPYGQP